MAHGLNSGAMNEWEEMAAYLGDTKDFRIGGVINSGEEFVNNENRGLFTSIEWDRIQNELKGEGVCKKTYMQTMIQAKVAELDEQDIDVLFMMNFSNNQGDFREQGAELKKGIDLVNPDGMKANVVAHSMGSLATASYIAGISGVEYSNDIDKFIAIGAPFSGSSGSNIVDKTGGWPLPRAKGPAYSNLRPGSEAINELQTTWNKNFGSQNKPFGVDFYSLQSMIGDGVVSWSSSTSLSGSLNIDMPFAFHTKQTKNINYQRQTYDILRNTWTIDSFITEY